MFSFLSTYLLKRPSTFVSVTDDDWSVEYAKQQTFLLENILG
jgi:hypothetical protein